MPQKAHSSKENDSEIQELAHGQIVVVTARWILVSAALLFTLWNPGPIEQMRISVIVIILLAFANFYLQTEIIRKKPTVKTVTYLATAGDLFVITLIVISQGGLSSNAYVFYFPAMLAFSVAFPGAFTILLTVGVLITYLAISAVSLGNLALDGITVASSDYQVAITRLIMFTAVAACGNLYRRIEHSRRLEAIQAQQQWQERDVLAGADRVQAAGAGDIAAPGTELPPGEAEGKEPVSQKPPVRRGAATWLWLTAATLGMLCTAAVAVVVLLGLLSSERRQASSLVKRASSLAQEGDCERAIELYSQAIELRPLAVKAYEGRAACYTVEGNYVSAQSDCDYLIETWPEDTRGYRCLNFIYRVKEDYKAVIDSYSRIIERAPRDQGAYNGRAWYLALTDSNLEQALADANQAIELQPYEAQYYDTRGFVYYKLTYYDKALEDYNTALHMNLNYAHYGRGLTYEALNDPGNAIADYEFFLKAYPNRSPESDDARSRMQGLEDGLVDSCDFTPSASKEVNLALRTSVVASRSYSDFKPALAVDGRNETWWGSGAHAPQWIELDLERPVTISWIRLIPSQTPSGATTHQVLFKTATSEDFFLVRICKGSTSDGRPLDVRLTPVKDVRFVRIVTTRSPSWVSWREIRVFESQ